MSVNIIVTIVLTLISLSFVMSRMINAKKPIYIFKTNFLNDRVYECIFILIALVSVIFSNINYYFTNKNTDINNILINIAILAVLLLLIILEYNKNQIGIYENGIILKSRYYKWDKIYTYRIKNMTDGSKKVVFYFYDKADRQKLNISSFYVNKDISEKIVKAIGENIDTTRS